jgi:hypothetical protein
LSILNIVVEVSAVSSRLKLTGFIFVTFQLWYSRRPLDDDGMRGRAYSTCEGGQGGAAASGTGLVECGKIGAGLNLNGDVDVGEINLSEMNPEDIRVSSST